MKDASISEKRLWKVWPGKNRFCCNGKYMAGPKSDFLYYIPSFVSLILIPNTFFIFVAPYIWDKVSICLPILSGIIYFITLSTYLLSTYTDPGILPRKNIIEILDQDSSSLDTINTDMSKYCNTCQIFKPRRSHHCKNCDNCVEIFDHHCSYINNCIGGRNYLYFFLFILSLTLLCLIDISGCLVFIFHDYSVLGPAKETFIKPGTVSLVVIVIMLAFITLIGVGALLLCLHHLSLCFTGKTTKEMIKGNEIGSLCYFWKKKPQRFDSRLILTEEQAKKITQGPFVVEISENYYSESN
ncbi:hypothetical protein SteCoe_4143 [Stentor coeruleus]|uniref:Palmitoyltransferase n=1 Tax=Stentor coeruleus TaxID=5963 RepID=A0A1R2CVD3_9CILI|nr:hypothetical protein SteCoe_4143 [Stentor coeruleus]